MIGYGQEFTLNYKAWNGTPVIDDAANHTISFLVNGTTIVAPATSPEEVNATFAPGEYKILVTANRSKVWSIQVTGTSSTEDVEIIGEKIKIKCPDLIMLGEAIRQGYDSTKDAIVEWADNDSDRGTNLKAAYNAAKAKSPSAKSPCTVWIPPWAHYVGSGLVVDTDYVNLIAIYEEKLNIQGIATQNEITYISRKTVVYTSSATNRAAITQSANHVVMRGFNVAFFTSSSLMFTYGLKIESTNNSGSSYDNMFFWHDRVTGFAGSVAFIADARGTWINCAAGENAWRLTTGSTIFAPSMYRCVGDTGSFCGDPPDSEMQGCHLYQCVCIGDYGFGGCYLHAVPIDENCLFMECVSGNYSFGIGVVNAGTFIRCRGGRYCFGSTSDVELECRYVGSFVGYAEDSYGGSGSFGGRKVSVGEFGKLSGKLVRTVISGNEQSHRIEGATIIDSTITMSEADQDCVTLLNSNSSINNSTLLVVEGGTGVAIASATPQTVSASGNHYNNASVSVSGLGANVTNLGASDDVTTDTASREASRANVSEVATAVAASILRTPAYKLMTSVDGDVSTNVLSRNASKADVSDLATQSAVQGLHGDISDILEKTSALPSFPAAVDDIPTPSAIASMVETVLAATHGEDVWEAGEGGGLTAEEVRIEIDNNGDRTGYSLSGTSISIGPTAQITNVDGHYSCPKGGTVGLYKRIRRWDGEDITQADIASIAYSIYALDRNNEDSRITVDGHETVSVAIADTIYDTVQTDSAASNYNFKYIPDILLYSAFSDTGTTYLVEFTLTPINGQKIIERFKVTAS